MNSFDVKIHKNKLCSILVGVSSVIALTVIDFFLQDFCFNTTNEEKVLGPLILKTQEGIQPAIV